MNAIYISGPMSGYHDHNFPAFHEAAALLRARGMIVINPAEINTDVNTHRRDCLRADVKAMAESCNKIYLLPKWEDSLGANLELHVAIELGFDIEIAPGAIVPMGSYKLVK